MPPAEFEAIHQRLQQLPEPPARARLNCISELLELIPHKKVKREKIKLEDRDMKGAYNDEVSLRGRKFVAARY